MKHKIYDFIIVGSGPSSIGALMAMKKANVAVITGERQNKKKINILNIHKKILFESKQKNYISNIYKFKKSSIFSINKVGGFGNYWGQGCEHVPYSKLIKKNYFKNENEYKKIINSIYNFFQVERKKESLTQKKTLFYPSPILENSPLNKNTGLNSFKLAFKYLKKKKKFIEIKSQVVRIQNFDKKILVELGNKKKILCKKLFLAANTIGNTKIIFESDKSVQKTSFLDDCPYLIYGVTNNRELNKFLSKSCSVIVPKLNNFFISLYNTNKINLSFLLFYFTGYKFNFLKKFNSRFLPFVKFIQIWDKKTKIQGFLERDMSYVVKEKKKVDNNYSDILNLFKIYIVKISQTKFGEGFHYHNLKIKKNNKWYVFDIYMKNFFNKRVLCLDSSSEEEINPGPFTITQMAIAYKKLQQNLK